jgi:hypothetical protein
MKRKLISLCLLPLIALSHAGHWEMDFDEDWAAASSAWSPLKLGDKLAVWFDASDNATVLNADGNPAADAEAVQTWLDKSGNARHATAPASGQRPSYRTAVQNGRAVLRTDGDDYLFVTNAGDVFQNKTAGYIFAVAKDANQTGGYSTHYVVHFVKGDGLTIRHNVSSRSVAGNGWAARGRRLDGDTLINVYCGPADGHTLVMAFGDWAAGYLRTSINGASCSSIAYSSGGGATSNTDGQEVTLMGKPSSSTSLPANSEIAEIIIINAAMTDAEVSDVQNYLKNKWGTP